MTENQRWWNSNDFRPRLVLDSGESGPSDGLVLGHGS